MTNRSRQPVSRQGAPAASLLSRPAPSVAVELGHKGGTGATPPAPVLPVSDDEDIPVLPVAPADQARLDEHKAKQAEYKAWMARMANETPAQAAVEAPVEPVAVVDPAQVAERAQQELLGGYLTMLAEQPVDEPRYVVSVRPPRPRVAGLQLAIGDVVPGAHNFLRLDSWLRAGTIVKA